ncbi:MAG: CRISPR-associated helicase Cas3', partial [Blastocatellia bacterium]|nr:CRISPR-associated helicase Cas3' [Blastocatellia bacterium]
TVIIDEVHAYDAYMSKLLELLLKWLAALGSPVVLLSATLPQKRREMLLKAYCQGLGYNCVTPQTISSYPRISWATRNGQEIVCNEEKLTTSESIKETTVKWVDGAIDPESSKFNLGEQLKSALSEGGCAVVICNTVVRAQEVYKKLKHYFSENELLLFHARFLFTDRDMKEEEVRSKFGKPSEKIESDSENKQERRKVERPYRSVLVATQVVEQSLDIDFDLMVTDIAPVDLVLQRLGRLHRHKRESRPNKLTKPQLWITEPKKIVDDTPTFDEGTEVVYDKHILLRSWLALKEKIEKDSLLSTPEDIEPLVEAVYSNQSCPQNATEQLKNYWEETYEELKEELQNMETKAKEVQIRPPNHEDGILNGTNEDLKEDNPEVHKSLQALTRLSDGPTVSVTILTEIESKKYNFNNPPDFEEVEYFLRHSVNLSRRDFVNHLFEITDREKLIPAGWKLSPFLRHHRLIKVDESGKWRSEKYELNLDPELGIIISKLD